MPRTWTRSMRLGPDTPSTISPSSSAVRSRSVCSRQLCTRAAPSNTPSTMLVLPTSMARSIRLGPGQLAAHDTHAAPLGLHEQRPLVVDIDDGARSRSVAGIPRDARAGRDIVAGAAAPAVEDSIEAAGEQIDRKSTPLNSR